MDFLLDDLRDYTGTQLLCGWRGNEYLIGGDALDVIRSEMPVCGTCDRATSGNASKFVAEVAEAEREAS